MKDNAIYWNEKKLTGTTKEYDSIYKWLKEEGRA
jgi:hypothetical protein